MSDEWQPIETAPKDGTSILLWPHYMVGSWDFGAEDWLFFNIPLTEKREIADDWTKPSPMWFEFCSVQTGVSPARWMPLPKGPDHG